MLQNKLKELINARGITAYRASMDVFGNKETAYKYIKDPTRIPRRVQLEKLCAYFQCEVSDIVTFTERQITQR